MKKPYALPRTPSQKKSRLAFMGEVIGNFLIVNAMVAVMGAFLVTPRHTMGATASANLDPSTGKPVLTRLQGCEIVTPARSDEGDER